MNDMRPVRDMISDAYSMTKFVYVDIETIPTQDASVIDLIRKDVKPPANLKKAESIDAWKAENGEAAAQEAVAKTSFDGGRGHVCTIAWAVNDGDVKVMHARTVEEELYVIGAFFNSLDAYHSTVLVGHNVAGFDLAFLRKRAICLGITLPPSQTFPRDPKPWDKGVFDTMTAWSGARDTISMDRLCGVLGIPGKGGMDGSQVAGAWAEGRHDEIASYCADDVRRTRAIHQRFLAVGF